MTASAEVDALPFGARGAGWGPEARAEALRRGALREEPLPMKLPSRPVSPSRGIVGAGRARCPRSSARANERQRLGND
jgi:hypothetical protein